MAAGDDSPARADPWRWTRVQASGSTPSFRRMWRRVEAVGVMCRTTRRHRRRRTTPRRGSRNFRDAFTPAPGSADRERTNTVRPCRCLRQFRRANPQRIRRYRISRADAATRWHRRDHRGTSRRLLDTSASSRRIPATGGSRVYPRGGTHAANPARTAESASPGPNAARFQPFRGGTSRFGQGSRCTCGEQIRRTWAQTVSH